jgi:hypothetical protein
MERAGVARARCQTTRTAPAAAGRKKYKVCHAAEDRAQAAAQPAAPARPLAEDLRAALLILQHQDVTRLTAALERLGALLSEWGPAPNLRFDAAAFDAHVTREFSRLAGLIEERPAQARHELRTSTVRALGTRAFRWPPSSPRAPSPPPARPRRPSPAPTWRRSPRGGRRTWSPTGSCWRPCASPAPPSACAAPRPGSASTRSHYEPGPT